jgi:hypothetical protein
MMDLFRCDEAVGRDGDWWMYSVDVPRLEEKLRLPVGSCNLALPLWGPTGTQRFDPSRDNVCFICLLVLILLQLHRAPICM